jgi:hypothetical protein
MQEMPFQTAISYSRTCPPEGGRYRTHPRNRSNYFQLQDDTEWSRDLLARARRC